MALTVSVDQIVESSANSLLAIQPRWKRVRLREVASVLNGYAFKSAQFSKSDGVPLIRIRDVGSDTTDTNYAGEFDDRYVVGPGDLLIGMDGDFNCARWHGPPGLLNQRVCKVTLHSDQYRARFLDYVLPGYLKAINDATSSVTVKHLSSRTVEDIPLPLPPVAEQEKIVAEFEKQFSRLDEAVANLKRVKANLRRYKAAVLKAAVEGRLVPTEAELAQGEGRTFEDAETFLTRVLAKRTSRRSGRERARTPLGHNIYSPSAIPAGWTWATLDQLSDVVRGGSPRPAGDPRYFGGPIPWITVGPITADESDYLREVPDGLTEAGRERSRFIETGTLLLTNSGATLGVPKISLISGCINDGVAALLGVDEPLKTYLVQFLRTRTASLRQVNQGAAQPNLNTSIIKAIAVPLPPVEEQHRIIAEVERRMSLVREIEYAVKANLARVISLRHMTLARAFVGIA